MKIHIPTPLRQFAAKQATVSVTASTVGQALDELTVTHPELKKHLYSEDGKLRAFVNVYLNDEDIRYLSDKENTPVKESDSLSIIPSIAGGSTATEAPAALPTLSNEEIARYSRHLILPEVGLEGQQKLKAAKVLCVGTGVWAHRWPFIWLPRASAPWGWLTLTWSTQATCSGRSSTAPRT